MAEFTTLHPPVQGVHENAKDVQTQLKELGAKSLNPQQMLETYGVEVTRRTWIMDHAETTAENRDKANVLAGPQFKESREAALAQLDSQQSDKVDVNAGKKAAAFEKAGDPENADRVRRSAFSNAEGEPFYPMKDQRELFEKATEGLRTRYDGKTGVTFIHKEDVAKLPETVKGFNSAEQKALWEAQPEIQAKQAKAARTDSEKSQVQKAAAERAPAVSDAKTPTAMYVSPNPKHQRTAINIVANMAERNPRGLDIKVAMAEADVHANAARYGAALGMARAQGVSVAAVYGDRPTMLHESRVAGVAMGIAALESVGYKRVFNGDPAKGPVVMPTEQQKQEAFPGYVPGQENKRPTVETSKAPDAPKVEQEPVKTASPLALAAKMAEAR